MHTEGGSDFVKAKVFGVALKAKCFILSKNVHLIVYQKTQKYRILTYIPIYIPLTFNAVT